jgi:hypothetical protein
VPHDGLPVAKCVPQARDQEKAYGQRCEKNDFVHVVSKYFEVSCIDIYPKKRDAKPAQHAAVCVQSRPYCGTCGYGEEKTPFKKFELPRALPSSGIKVSKIDNIHSATNR